MRAELNCIFKFNRTRQYIVDRIRTLSGESQSKRLGRFPEYTQREPIQESLRKYVPLMQCRSK